MGASEPSHFFRLSLVSWQEALDDRLVRPWMLVISRNDAVIVSDAWRDAFRKRLALTERQLR